MAEKTGISWTHHTFNAWWGCEKVSPACTNCYAETLAARFGVGWGPHAPRKTFGEKHWNDPLRWDRKAKKDGVKRRVFCGSMMDLFENHPAAHKERPKLWPLIRKTPNLNWLLLTKRPENILGLLPGDWSVENYPNVWMGTTVENNAYARRADHLRAVPAKVRFISYEPALGPLDKLNLGQIDWLIFGGESGPGFRPHNPEWAKDILDRCLLEKVAFFYKQGSGLKSGGEPHLDGVEYRQFPGEK